MNSRNKRQFGLTHPDENCFIINPHNPKNVIITETSLTFQDGDGIENTYDLTDPDPKFFLSNTTFEKDRFFDENLSKCFYKDLGWESNFDN